ncbi:MAG: sigma-70 family RNA polymerase sigma factor [Microbacterium sp.]|uniref:sigma-70 family RNA polymerase sigma factor n=1 Tax=Microbacterium sp. TaxID=51671 RepID=UPI003F7F10CC
MTTPIRAVAEGPLRERSDEQLVLATRAGDNAAYAVLWERHVASGRSAARAVSPNVDPDDIVSEAFTSILSAIRKGGGPHEGFRPYLFATIRNVAASWGRRTQETPLDDLDERASESEAEFAELVADRSVLAQAFRELPERWRELLWYVEVEGMKPREIAPLLGMSANAVSALAYRAREGFKQAWLQAHISDPARPAECRWVCELLVASEKKPVKRGDRRRLDAHLQECQACRIVAADLEHVSQKLRLVLLPLVLGGAGALAYASDAAPAAASVVAGSPTGGGGASGSGGQAPGGASGGGVGAGGAGTAAVPVAAIGIGVGVLAVAAAAAVAIALAPSWSAPVENPVSADVTTTDRDAADAVETAPDGAAAETADAPPAVDAPPAGAVDTPALPPAAAPRTAPIRLVETAPRPAPAPVTPAPEPSTPNPSPSPTPTPTPTPDPGPATTATARLDAPADLSAPVPAPISGTGVAGADVVLLDESGTVLARTTADTAGRFSAAIPGDLLHQGMSVRAVQTAPGLAESAASEPVGPFALPVPTVTSSDGTLEARLEDLDFDFRADDLTLLLSGLRGQTVAVAIDGAWTGNLHTLTGAPLSRVVYNVSPGDHVLGIRYVDPATGRQGLVSYVTLHVSAR